MLQLLQHTPNLALRGAIVTGLVVEDARVSGIRTYFGSSYAAGAVVLTAGTFLGGQIWVAERRRAGCRAPQGSLEALGFQMGRLKTGTPARVDRRSNPWGSWRSSPAMPKVASSPLIPPAG